MIVASWFPSIFNSSFLSTAEKLEPFLVISCNTVAWFPHHSIQVQLHNLHQRSDHTSPDQASSPPELVDIIWAHPWFLRNIHCFRFPNSAIQALPRDLWALCSLLGFFRACSLRGFSGSAIIGCYLLRVRFWRFFVKAWHKLLQVPNVIRIQLEIAVATAT